MAITSRSRPLADKAVASKTANATTSTDETLPRTRVSAARRSRTSAVRKRGIFAVNVPGWVK